MWTCKYDFNTVRVGADFFKYGRKNLRVRKYPDMCGRALDPGLGWGTGAIDNHQNFEKKEERPQFTCHVMHRARALSTKMNNDRADSNCYSFA